MIARLLFTAALLTACSGAKTDTETSGEPLTVSKPVEAAQLPIEPEYSPGTHVFSGNSDSLTMLGEGWSTPEVWGIWSEGSSATLNFAPVLADTEMLHIFFYVFPSPANLDFEQTINVTLDGDMVDTWSFSPDEGPGCTSRQVYLATNGDGDTERELRFDIASPVSPNEVNGSSDTRALGIGVIQIIEITSGATPPKSPC